MIGRLTGKIEILNDDSVIIDVSGVGYHVYVSSNTLANLQNAAVATLQIDTHVREDLIHLYGFLNQEEKDCFLKLNLVSGVGTKVALSILSAMTPEDVRRALTFGDKDAFKQVSGIGTKLAERIILELKDKNFISSSNIQIGKSDVQQDAVSALSNLGLNRNDATIIVQKLVKENPSMKLDEIIRLALKSRSS